MIMPGLPEPESFTDDKQAYPGVSKASRHPQHSLAPITTTRRADHQQDLTKAAVQDIPSPRMSRG
jgi:hypothetical protein